MNDEAENNFERQDEELDVLKCILGEDAVSVKMLRVEGKMYRNVRIDVVRASFSLIVELPHDYPSSSPPIFRIVGSTLSDKMIEACANKCVEMYDNTGDVCIYQAVEYLSERIAAVSERTEAGFEEEKEEEEEEARLLDATTPVNDLTRRGEDGECLDRNKPLAIYHGEPFTDRKSTFQAHLSEISTSEGATEMLRQLLCDNKIARATHNIWAYRIIEDASGIVRRENDDDGETAAGKRLGQLLEAMEAENVCVVVSRWYGGVHLGPARFRHINNVARALVEACDRSRRLRNRECNHGLPKAARKKRSKKKKKKKGR